MTPAGVQLLTTARATLLTLEHGVHQARRIAQGQSDELRLGSLALAGHPELPTGLKRFRQQWPDIELKLHQASSAQLTRMLLEDPLDLALLLALPADHPQDCETSVPLADFADAPFVFTPPTLGNRYHQHLLELLTG
nr:LysR substrate-binding domain-containing protein [Pantoea sp. Cy-639]